MHRKGAMKQLLTLFSLLLITALSRAEVPTAVAEALKKAGINVQSALFKNLDSAVGFLMGKYKGMPEFEESFFQVE